MCVYMMHVRKMVTRRVVSVDHISRSFAVVQKHKQPVGTVLVVRSHAAISL